MKNLLKLASLIGLVLTIAPPVFFFLGRYDLDQMKFLMGIGMAIWFVSAPFWVNKPASKVQ